MALIFHDFQKEHGLQHVSKTDSGEVTISDGSDSDDSYEIEQSRRCTKLNILRNDLEVADLLDKLIDEKMGRSGRDSFSPLHRSHHRSSKSDTTLYRPAFLRR